MTRQGIAGVAMLIGLSEDENNELIPPLARDALVPLVEQLRAAHEKVRELDHQIHSRHRSNELSRRLETIPGIGPITCLHPSGDKTTPSDNVRLAAISFLYIFPRALPAGRILPHPPRGLRLRSLRKPVGRVCQAK